MILSKVLSIESCVYFIFCPFLLFSETLEKIFYQKAVSEIEILFNYPAI